MANLSYTIDDIKLRLNVYDVAQRLNIDVPSKKDAVCPVHHGQSLRLHESHWYCFGSCRQGGDIISLVQFVDGSDFMTALKQVASWAGVTLDISPEEQRRAEQRRRVEDVLAVAADFYASLYPGSPAQSYAQGRGLDVADARLGYAPDAWRTLVDHLQALGIDPAQAEEAGLIKTNAKGYFDQIRGRLVIPAYHQGRCVYLTGRALDDSKDEKGDRVVNPKYLHAALKDPPLYHLNGALRKGSTPIVTESPTDVLRFESHHLPGVGTYGNALKEHQAAILKRFEMLFIAAHNDSAGAAFVNSCAVELGERIRVAPAPAPYNDWDEALAAGQAWAPDAALTWFRWSLARIPSDSDPVTSKPLIAPLLNYLSALDDAALSTHYLDEMRKHFGWSRDIHRAYDSNLKAARAERRKQSTDAQRVKSDDAGQTINVKPDPIFINPAQAYHSGIVYVARQITRRVTVSTKHSEDKYDKYGPAIITSDRRLIDPPELPRTAPTGAVIYLDDAETLALRKPMEQADSKWSYTSYSSHLSGTAPDVQPHEIYDQLLASVKKYVYFSDPGDYIIAALWAMGTFFHQQFDAFPRLILNGHKGAGKTTLLHWLHHVAFNSMHVVNLSEASLFRWVEATAPTMLLDEQEGMNSRKAGKEEMAALMGLIKAGYQKGAVVTRQDPNNPAITQSFSIYSPMALAAVEALEDILADRGILVYMPKVRPDVLAAHNIVERKMMQFDDFQTMRDSLFLMLMQHSDSVQAMQQKVKNSQGARFGELVFPLLTLAGIVDLSRGAGRGVLNDLESAIEHQSTKRDQRNEMTPENMLADAVRVVIETAVPRMFGQAMPGRFAEKMPDGTVVMDALHISEAFASLFPSAKDSFFHVTWLGNQVAKTTWIERYRPLESKRDNYRWHRSIQERNPQTFEVDTVEKTLSVYRVHPDQM